MLDKGAKVDEKDSHGWTPLNRICWETYPPKKANLVKIATLLLDRGAFINTKDSNQWTPLHHAAHHGLLELVELLLKRGANINERANYNRTPLGIALAQENNEEVVKLLVSKGATK